MHLKVPAPRDIWSRHAPTRVQPRTIQDKCCYGDKPTTTKESKCRALARRLGGIVAAAPPSETTLSVFPRLPLSLFLRFANALQLFPSAEFIGKLEEDTVIHAARLVLELREASRVSHLSWYGLFQWAAADQDRPDKVAYCGESTNAWLGGGPAVGCRRDWPAAFAHPFASGGLDVRSRNLVNETRSCMQDQGMFERMFGEHNSCDNFLGYLLWKCTARAFLFDLTFRKWAHPHVQFTEARRAHATLIHPAKDTARHQWDVPGPALAPVAMIARRVITGRRVHVEWRPLNATAVQRFQEVFDVAKHPEPCREAPEVCYRRRRALR